MRREFENICRLTQKQLIIKNLEVLKKEGYKEIIRHDGFIFAKGEIPVLLVAHMDTVHKEIPQIIEYIDKGNILSSPQGIGGDDRCGVYMIHEIIKTHKCHILFTEDEEIGGIGISKFINSPYLNKLKDLNINYMIELDRKGNNDAVFYECENPEFTEFITEDSGLKENFGSYTDICDLMPEVGVAGVNISCGYYNAHQKTEYVNFTEMKLQIERAKEIINKPCDKPFEFIEALSCFDDSWFSSYDYYSDYAYRPNLEDNSEKVYYIEYVEKLKKPKSNKRPKRNCLELLARSEAEAVGMFLMNEPKLTFEHIEEIFEE